MAEEIVGREFEKKILRADFEIYCGTILTDKLRRGGLSFTDIKKIEQGIRFFKSTSLAYDDYGRIIDWGQYYEEARIIVRRYGEDIDARLRSLYPAYSHIIYYDHIIRDDVACLKISHVPR